jgi:DNA repair protein RecO
VNEVELLECLSVAKPSLEMASVLFYMAELTHKLIQDSQHVEGAYALLKESLQHLSISEGRADTGLCETLLHSYIIKLFTLLGFMPSWDTCTHSGEKLNLSAPLYLCASDFSVVPQEYAEYNDRRLTPTLIKWVNFMQKYPLPAILQVRTTEGERREIMGLLEILLGSTLTSPLRAHQFYESITLP